MAYGNSGEFTQSVDAIKAGASEMLPQQGKDAAAIAGMQKLRKQHAGLFGLWQQGQLSPRTLRMELVKYYVARGQRQIDERFFAPAKTQSAGP